MADYRDRALAFAGIVECAYLVATLAKRGIVSQDSFDACLATVFVTDPDQVADVYPGGQAVTPGLAIAEESLGKLNRSHAEVIRYVFALVQLQKRLRNAPETLARLGEGIEAAKTDNNAGSLQRSAALAQLYDDILGRFEPRIIVRGDPVVLQNRNNVNRVRALLLAGVRSAVLWHQAGGRNWQLVLARRHYLEALDYLKTTLVKNTQSTLKANYGP